MSLVRLVLVSLIVTLASVASVQGVIAGEFDRLAYGSRAGMDVMIVGKSGIGTSKAVIKIKLTIKNAAEHCKWYLNDTTAKCAKRVLKEDGARLKPSVSANCKSKTWRDMYGNVYALRGNNTYGEFPEYVVVNQRTSEILDGSSASGYLVAINAFKALCPRLISKKTEQQRVQVTEKIYTGYKEGDEIEILFKKDLDSKVAVIAVRPGFTLLDRIKGNCFERKWTDFEGRMYSFEGQNKEPRKAVAHDSNGPVPTDYIIKNIDTGEIADGSSMSRYDLELKYFQALCPKTFSYLLSPDIDHLEILRDGKSDLATQPPVPSPIPIEVLMMAAVNMKIESASNPPPDPTLRPSPFAGNTQGYVISPGSMTEARLPDKSDAVRDVPAHASGPTSPQAVSNAQSPLVPGGRDSKRADKLSLEERVAALEATAGNSDRVICKTALSRSGVQWESAPEFKGAVDEALRRNFSIEKCRVALGYPYTPAAIK